MIFLCMGNIVQVYSLFPFLPSLLTQGLWYVTLSLRTYSFFSPSRTENGWHEFFFFTILFFLCFSFICFPTNSRLTIYMFLVVNYYLIWFYFVWVLHGCSLSISSHTEFVGWFPSPLRTYSSSYPILSDNEDGEKNIILVCSFLFALFYSTTMNYVFILYLPIHG